MDIRLILYDHYLVVQSALLGDDEEEREARDEYPEIQRLMDKIIYEVLCEGHTHFACQRTAFDECWEIVADEFVLLADVMQMRPVEQ